MTILDDILRHKREEVVAAKKAAPLDVLKQMPWYSRPTRSLRDALAVPGPVVIAEVKKASPSKGVIRADFNPVQIATSYVGNGAAALSVLTDEKYFHGSLRYLSDIRAVAAVPVLRKDFIIDAYQVHEARAYGADAILLIAAALEPESLGELHEEARRIGLDVLVEVHSEEEIDALRGIRVSIFGVNNRDLRTFQTSLDVTVRLAGRIPDGALLVSESGIGAGRDVALLASRGVHAVLVGESLMRASDPGGALAELLREARAGMNDQPTVARVRVKICGITRVEDAAAAVAAGADALGFVFVPSSPRSMTFESAAKIIETLPPFVTPVGVFLRPSLEDIREAARVARIRLAQVHEARGIEGEGLPVPVLHAVRVGPGFDHSVLRAWGMPEYLLDAHVEGRDGGTGKAFDWSVAAEAGKYSRIVLAGGLTPENVSAAIEIAGPYAVDVSSGVEAAPGIKSASRISAFVKAVRAAKH